MNEKGKDIVKSGLWSAIAGYFVGHRYIALLAAILVTVGGIIATPLAPFDPDPTGYLPRENPTVKTWLEASKRFGALDLLMVGIEENDTPLSTEGLSRLSRITERLNQHKADGILNARSITNVDSMTEDEDGQLNADLLIPSIPRTEAGRKAMMEKVLANTQVVGALVSADLMAYTVVIRPDYRKDPQKIAALVRKIVESERGPLSTYFFGTPFFTLYTGKRVAQQMIWLAPLMLILFLGIHSIGIGRPRNFLLVLLCSAGSLLWWQLFLAIFGFVQTSASASAALLLMIANSLIFSNDLQRWLSRDAANSPSSPLSKRSVEFFILLTISFAAAGYTDLPFISDFAYSAAIGFIASLFFALLVFAPIASFWNVQEDAPKTTAKRLPLNFGKSTVGLFVILLLLGLGANRIQYAVTLEDMFSTEGEIGQSLDFFDRRLEGYNYVQITYKADLRDPAQTDRLMLISDMLEGEESFTDVRSITQVLGFLAKQFSGLHRIPNNRDALDNLWFFLAGNVDVLPMVNDSQSEAMIAARLPKDSELTASQLKKIVNESIAKATSLETQPLCKARLSALATRYNLELPETAIDESIAIALAPPQTAKVRYREKALQTILAYLQSPNSPFDIEKGDWEKISQTLVSDPEIGSLSAVLQNTEGFKSMGYPPEMAGQQAETLLIRKRTIELEEQSMDLARSLLAVADTERSPEAFFIRSQGVFADFLSPPKIPETMPEIHICGLPVVKEEMASASMKGLWGALFSLFAVIGVGVAFFGIGKSNTLVVLLESVFATLLALFVGWISGLGIDSSSASFFMIPAATVLLLTTSMGDRSNPDLIENRRYASVSAIAYAFTLLLLLLTGVTPVMRIGSIAAISILSATIVTYLSKRILYENDGIGTV